MDLHQPIALRELTVVRVERPTPRLARVTLGGDQLRGGDVDGHRLPPFRTDAPDDHVRLVLPHPRTGRAVLPVQREGHLDWPHDPPATHRDYTVRRFDPDAGEHGEVVLDLVLHGAGPAAGWAAGLRVGDTAHIAGPRGSRLPDTDAHRWLLVADETGLPAVGRFLDERDGVREVRAVVLVEDAEEEQTALAGVTWIHRRDRDGHRRGEDAELLADAVAALPRAAPTTTTWAWVAAEDATVRAVRVALHEHHGLTGKRVRGLAYWRRRAADDTPPDAGDLTALRAMTDLVTPWAIRVAVTLGLLDALAAGARTATEVATRTGTDPTGVAAVLAHLGARDIVREDADGVTLGRLAAPLLTGSPARDLLDLDGAAGHIDRAWSGLRHAVTTGEPGFDRVFDGSFWQVVDADQQLSRSFDAYIAGNVTVWGPGAVSYLDRIGARAVVDVGGGDGTFLASALASDPARRGVVVERAHTAAAATALFSARGLSDRAHAVARDFRASVPHGYDTYVLAQVLHDWGDATAREILRRCAEAAGRHGRVLVVERLVGDRPHTELQLMMLNLFAGRERGLAEVTALARDAGLRVVDALPISESFHLVDLRHTDPATDRAPVEEPRP